LKGLVRTEMKIILSEYKEGVAKDVQQDYDPKQLDMEFVDLEYSKPLHMEGVIEKEHDTLAFRGHLTSATVSTCGRCLKKVPANVDRDFELFYETKNKEVIDTTDDFRELLILEHPLSYLCSENCRGLCPNCGTNLNESKCSCAAKAPSVLATLKDLLQKKKK
jgi:uncharacterized protein